MEQHSLCRALRLNILGALEIWDGNRQLRFSGALKERVLATLLLERDRVVPVARLVEACWEDEPPASAFHQIRKAVADLRRRIPGGSELILTDGPGYRISLAEEQLDLGRFRAGLRGARQAVRDGRDPEAVGLLRTALAQWRGPVLAGAGGPVFKAASVALEEQRLDAIEQLNELLLRAGDTDQLIGELRELVAAHPLRETLRGQLMLALYRTGRQAEALEEYARVRQLLSEELGIDPGAALVKLHADILRQRPELSAAVRGVPEAAGPSALPYDLPDFAGRATELHWIVGQTERTDPSSPRIIAIDGMGGSGKTSLAVRAAHRLARQYPDGQLFLDLRGFTPGEEPLTVYAAAESLLRSAGVPAEQIPDTAEARTTLWRSVTARRTLLLILDNAAHAEQVRALVPASADCLTLVTSRARLVDLDGAQWVSLEVLSPDDSAEFLRHTLGRERIDQEPVACAQLAELCGHLPLALRIATARLRNRSRWTVRYLVDRMADETRRLHELSSADRGVAPVLRLSYEALNVPQRTAMRLLGLHPGRLIDVHAAAALLGADSRSAEEMLEDLLDARLLEQRKPGLYEFHDLVRSFAHALRGEETAEQDGRAVERLLDYVLLAAEHACDALFPRRERFDQFLPPTDGVGLPPLRTAGDALRWLDQHHDSLLKAVALAYQHGLLRHAAYLPRAVSFHSHLRNYPGAASIANTTAVAAARELNEPVLLQLALDNMAVARSQLGAPREGITLLEESIGIARSTGDEYGEASCLSRLGQLYNNLGEFTEALRYLDRAVALHRRLGSPAEEALALTNISSVTGRLGRYGESQRAARHAIDLYEHTGEVHSSVIARSNLSFALLGLRRPEEAMEHLGQALDLCGQLQKPTDTALILARTAETCLHLGRMDEAREHCGRALELTQLGGPKARQAAVENTVGRVHRVCAEYAQARERHENAHKLAIEIEHRFEMAMALNGLAEASRGMGESGIARDYLSKADALFEQMGILGGCRWPTPGDLS